MLFSTQLPMVLVLLEKNNVACTAAHTRITCHGGVEEPASRRERREERCWRYSKCILLCRASCGKFKCPYTATQEEPSDTCTHTTARAGIAIDHPTSAFLKTPLQCS